MVWLGMPAWYTVWPDNHGMVYDMALQAWHGICSGLMGMAWYMVLPGGPVMVYGMSWWAWHGIWYCLARYGIAYGVAGQRDMYMVWPGGHCMVYAMVYRACHDIWSGMAGMAL